MVKVEVAMVMNVDIAILIKIEMGDSCRAFEPLLTAVSQWEDPLDPFVKSTWFLSHIYAQLCTEKGYVRQGWIYFRLAYVLKLSIVLEAGLDGVFSPGRALQARGRCEREYAMPMPTLASDAEHELVRFVR
ncbi:hypothetical protein PoB_002369900 [Plakobranchus ocellatus]|uniref:Uncharacterized protein n=1 Tax=Plakobranchus ocellatus TaxID=259542 RepID=A0AAV3ZTJ4_9GAST|nr:hypothetical protein PoB_002369900 [Plakobranchus ocellatus]